MNITNAFIVRDSTVLTGDNRKAGLTPTWVFIKKLADNSDVTPQPAIAEIVNGQYKFSYDAESNGEAAGQIDVGSSLTNPSDRYVDVLLTRDSSRVQSALASGGTVNLPTLAGLSADKAHRVLIALLGGKTTVGSSTVTFLDTDNTTPVITITYGSTPGSRTAVTIN